MSNHLLAASINTTTGSSRTGHYIGYNRLGLGCNNKDKPKIPSVSKQKKFFLAHASGPPQIGKGLCWAGASPHFSHSRTQLTEKPLLSTGLCITGRELHGLTEAMK